MCKCVKTNLRNTLHLTLYVEVKESFLYNIYKRTMRNFRRVDIGSYDVAFIAKGEGGVLETCSSKTKARSRAIKVLVDRFLSQ